MPFLKHFTILTYNFPVQALSTVSFLCEGEPPPPISTPWGAYRPHKAATRCSEPTWNAHYSSLTINAGTHFTYPQRDGGLSQPQPG